MEPLEEASSVPTLAFLCKTALFSDHGSLKRATLQNSPDDVVQELFRDLRKTRTINTIKDLKKFRSTMTKVGLAEVGYHLNDKYLAELTKWSNLEYVNHTMEITRHYSCIIRIFRIFYC
jgi:hypothetical protein